MAPPTLQDLIREVEHDAPDDQPLTRLRIAASMMQAVNEVTDAALGYFVDQARRAGHSWSEIGESLGVSKQAAQQRHVARATSGGMMPVTFERFTDRARSVVALSESVARDLGHTFIGTEHLLLAQFSMPEGLAGQVLLESGLTKQKVRDAILDQIGRGPGTGDDRPSFTQKAALAFTGALAVALELGHNYIGTEHLLLGVARTDGVGASILRNAGLDEDALRPKVVARLAAFVRSRGAEKAAPAGKSAKAAKAAKAGKAPAKKSTGKRGPQKA